MKTLATTEATGAFLFPAVLPGAYTVKVEVKGFQTLIRTGNQCTPNERLALGDLRLAIGSVAESVTVPRLFQTGREKLFFFYSVERNPSQMPLALQRFTMPTELERRGRCTSNTKEPWPCKRGATS